MACDVSKAECLADHVLPHLERVSESGTDPGQYRARCPVREHDDRKPSLSLRIGDKKPDRIIWECHAGCDPAEVRAAMVRAGVHDGCLTRVPGQRTEDALVSALLELLAAQPFGPLRDLLILAMVRRIELPRGKRLVELGETIGLRRTAVLEAGKKLRAVTEPVTEQSVSRTSVTEPVTERESAKRTSGSRDELPCHAPTREVDKDSVTGAPYIVAGLNHTPPARRCGACEAPLPPSRTARAEYCNDKCRQDHHRAKLAKAVENRPEPAQPESPPESPVPEPAPEPPKPAKRPSRPRAPVVDLTPHIAAKKAAARRGPLAESVVAEIWRRAKRGESTRDISQELGIASSTVLRYVNQLRQQEEAGSDG
jgi:biotin operon repressor